MTGDKVNLLKLLACLSFSLNIFHNLKQKVFFHAYLVDEQSFRIQEIYKAYKLMYIPSGDTQNNPFFRLWLKLLNIKRRTTQ